MFYNQSVTNIASLMNTNKSTWLVYFFKGACVLRGLTNLIIGLKDIFIEGLSRYYVLRMLHNLTIGLNDTSLKVYLLRDALVR